MARGDFFSTGLTHIQLWGFCRMRFLRLQRTVLSHYHRYETCSCRNPHFVLSSLSAAAAAHSLPTNELPRLSESSLFPSCTCGSWRFLPLSLSVRLPPRLLTALFACAVTETDGWNNRERREGGWEGGGVGVDAGEGRRGQQSKEARRWLRDFEALPPLVASLPVCVADNLLTPQRLIRHLCWSPLDLVTLRSWPGLKKKNLEDWHVGPFRCYSFAINTGAHCLYLQFSPASKQETSSADLRWDLEVRLKRAYCHFQLQ